MRRKLSSSRVNIDQLQTENSRRIEKDMEEMTPESTLTMAFRIVAVERDIIALKTQVNLSVPLKENDLNLQIIHGIIERMEKEVDFAKNQAEDVMKRQIDQGHEAQVKLEEQKVRQANLQIKYLWGIISVVISFIISLLVAYITHLFH